MLFTERYAAARITVVTLPESGEDGRLLCRVLHQNPMSIMFHGCPSSAGPSEWLEARVLGACRSALSVSGRHVPLEHAWLQQGAAAAAAELAAAVGERRTLTLRTRTFRGAAAGPSVGAKAAEVWHQVALSAGTDPVTHEAVLVVTETEITELVRRGISLGG